jgi:tetratricopeptide (TPR) repeat protein
MLPILTGCAFEARERTLGPDHAKTLQSLYNLGNLYKARKDLDRAIPLLHRELEAMKRLHGPDHKDTLSSRVNLAPLLEQAGDIDGADQQYRAALDGRIKLLGAVHAKTALSANNLAWFLFKQGDTSAQEHFAICARSWTDPDDWKHHWARLGTALCESIKSKEFSGAEAIIDEIAERFGADHIRVQKGLEVLELAREHAGTYGRT